MFLLKNMPFDSLTNKICTAMNLLAELQAVFYSILTLLTVQKTFWALSSSSDGGALLYSAFKNEPTVIKNLTRAKTPRSCVSFRGLKSAYLPVGALLCS